MAKCRHTPVAGGDTLIEYVPADSYIRWKSLIAHARIVSRGWSEIIGKWAGNRHGGAFLLQPTVHICIFSEVFFEMQRKR